MAVPQVPGDINQEDLINSVNNVVRELNNKEQVQVFKDEAGTRRVILDKDGLRTSPAGVDVFSAANDQLTFNSNNNVFKIVASGTTTIDADATAGVPINAIIAHGLGYAPAFIVYFTDSTFTDSYMLPMTTNLSTSASKVAFGNWIDSSVDVDNLYISFYSPVTANWGTMYFKYYLLQETAN